MTRRFEPSRWDMLIRTGVGSRVLDPLWDQYVFPRLREQMLTKKQIWDRCQEEGTLWTIEQSEAIPTADAFDCEREFRSVSEGYDCSPRRVCELSNAILFGDRGIVQTADGEFVYESFKNYPPYVRANLSEILQLLLRSAVRRNVDGFELPSSNSTHFRTAMSMVMHTIDPAQYGHWLIEYLPRLLALSVYEKRTGRAPDLIVPRNPPEWMLESLEILGYSDERLIEWSGGIATVDRLIQPFTSTSNESVIENEFSPIEHRWLRTRFLDEVRGTDASGERRYYVSRQGLDARYIANFDEIEPVLEKYDFDVVRPEELGFRESVELFSSGKTFVGSHGSGLHNILFARDATVVEAFPPDVDKPSNRLLAHELGHDYVSIAGTRFAPGVSKKKIERAPYEIDPEELDSTLEQVVSS